MQSFKIPSYMKRNSSFHSSQTHPKQISALASGFYLHVKYNFYLTYLIYLVLNLNVILIVSDDLLRSSPHAFPLFFLIVLSELLFRILLLYYP